MSTAILSGEACLQVDGIRSIFLWISTFTLFLDLKVIGVGVSRYRYMLVCVCVFVFLWTSLFTMSNNQRL